MSVATGMPKDSVHRKHQPLREPPKTDALTKFFAISLRCLEEAEGNVAKPMASKIAG
jgi:hypothetical protein